ncbi:PilN domain-containing protein [Motiliproteus sediminis]|uniref:PilN domain-containing protein n=1 Tax=Motiliproteus sediminis TaxID=1468178 RepID=UPI001AEFFBC1
MIRQQINLYVRHEKVRVPFGATICALIVLITTLLVSGLAIKEQRALQQINDDVAAAKAAKSARSVEIALLQRQLNERRADPVLQQRQQQLTHELRARNQFGRMLDQLRPAQRIPFSALMQGLADQAVSGLWLTRISARAGGRTLQLQGETQQPELIPRYLRRLGNEESYRAAEFDGVQISQQQSRLRFEVTGELKAGGRS